MYESLLDETSFLFFFSPYIQFFCATPMCDLTNSGSLVNMFVKSDPMTLLKTELERKKKRREEEKKRKKEKGKKDHNVF